MAIDAEVMTEDNAIQMASALANYAHYPGAASTGWGRAYAPSSVAPVGFEGFLLSAELGGETGQLPLPRREGERVNLLWTTPVTAAEQAFAMAEEGAECSW